MMMKSEFQDRLAVGTGASSGIGLALCAALLQRGARVLAMSRSIGGLEPLLETHADQLQWLSGDVTSAEALAQLARRAGQMGSVHYLVPTAGIAALADGLDQIGRGSRRERGWPQVYNSVVDVNIKKKN